MRRASISNIASSPWERRAGALSTPIVTLALAALGLLGSCTILSLGQTPCDVDADCKAGEACKSAFCQAVEGEGEGGVEGEGEGGVEGEGEGGEGEGDGGEGEGDGGEGEGDGGEGEGEGEGDPPIVLCGEDHVVPAWFDPSFPFRVPLAFCDTGAPNTAVVGLPVTVSLNAASFAELGSIAADGRDVIFVDQRGGGGTVLPYERQVYVDNSAAVFHVRVGSFNPSTGLDDMWMYFGSADGVERSDPNTTYPDYSSVWHFDDAGTLLREAKSGAVLSGVNVSATAGAFAGGIRHTGVDGGGVGSFAFLQPFDGNGNAVAPPTPPSSASASYSMLANPFSLATAGQNGEFTMIISELNTPTSPCVDNVSICTTFFNDGSYRVYAPSSAGFVLQTSGPGLVPLNVFRHHSLSWSATGFQGTFDGNLVINVAATVTANFPVENIVLGMGEQNNNGPFNGVLDEVRISNVPRDPAFFRAEARAYSGTLLERGAVEAR